jgi:predicted nucleotidyltransferase
MKQIFKTIYGSHLYGSNVETSDTDFKGVYLPSAREILIGKVPKTETHNSNNQKNTKNTKEDTDIQLYSIGKFLNDLAGGQTYALELLFASEEFWTEEPDKVWHNIRKNTDKLISSDISALIGYARAQAYKYGEKGKRLGVFNDVVDFLKPKFPGHKLVQAFSSDPKFKELQEKHKDFIKIKKFVKDEVSDTEYIDVNGVAVPLGASVEYALSVYEPRAAEYGARATQAMLDGGIDLKAVYHSVRISKQGTELLETGNITFPRPESKLLLEIRNNHYTIKQLTDIVDSAFEEVRQAEKTSKLPKKVNRKFIDDLLINAHIDVIMDECDLQYKPIID